MSFLEVPLSDFLGNHLPTCQSPQTGLHCSRGAQKWAIMKPAALFWSKKKEERKHGPITYTSYFWGSYVDLDLEEYIGLESSVYNLRKERLFLIEVIVNCEVDR